MIGYRFSQGFSKKTDLREKLNDNKVITFLINGINKQEKLVFSVFLFLQPEQKLCGMYFINPLSFFEKETIENLGPKASPTMIQPLEKITGLNINYTLTLQDTHLAQIIDLMDGLPFYLDKYSLPAESNFKRSMGPAVMSGEEVLDLISIIDPLDPLSYITRLNFQQSIFLSLIDRLNEKKELKSEWIKLLSLKTSSNLSPEEFISLFDYLIGNHLIFSIAELPGQLLIDEETKLSRLKIFEGSANEGFSRLVSYLSSGDYNIGDLARTEVLNSTETNGLAKSVKTILNENGIKVLSVGNGWNVNEAESVIIDRSGNTEYAYKIAKILGIKKVYHLINKEVGLDITVLLGEDFDFKSHN
ncbi:MAG: LCP family protein [Leptospiraceae bacterium]|nr:LCP family protein [Leptospiraceae bacterium]